MRILRLCAAGLLLATVTFAYSQVWNSAFPKYGADARNTQKAKANGPANPALLTRWTTLGATEQPTYGPEYITGMMFPAFWAPQGPQLRVFIPGLGAANYMDTSPGNTSSVTHIDLYFNLHDTSGDGIYGDPDVNSGNVVYPRAGEDDPPVSAAAWSGYGRNYLVFANPFAAGYFEVISFTLDAGDWRCVAPAVGKALTIPLKDEDAPLIVTGIVFVTVWGDVYIRYVNDEYDGDDHTFSWINPWLGLEEPVAFIRTFSTIYNNAPPAVDTTENTLCIADHFGSIFKINLFTAGVPWALAAEESFDSPIVLNSARDLLLATTISPELGRDGNRLYKVPKDGNVNNVLQVDLDGSIVGGPAYNASNNSCYVATLGNQGSTLYKINGTTLTVESSRSDLGPLRADPIIDASGNIYIGNELGFLYSLDEDLNVRPNWPVWVGAPIYTGCCISDEGYLAVPTGRNFTVYGEADSPIGSGVTLNPKPEGRQR
jgi:hypothetical protein